MNKATGRGLKLRTCRWPGNPSAVFSVKAGNEHPFWSWVSVASQPVLLQWFDKQTFKKVTYRLFLFFTMLSSTFSVPLCVHSTTFIYGCQDQFECALCLRRVPSWLNPCMVSEKPRLKSSGEDTCRFLLVPYILWIYLAFQVFEIFFGLNNRIVCFVALNTEIENYLLHIYSECYNGQ